MPILNWIGKEKIVNHDKDVPFRLLRKNKKYSLGKSENLIIEGDNLEALKALMPFYYGKIKCIYIDPPYNTGNEKWVYNDKVNAPKIKEWLGRVVGPEGEDLCRHDKWLCMMYPRLKLLRELLRDDGVIFISIDDNEHCNLKMMMDEIFGESNFIGTFIINTTPNARDYGHIAKMHEFCLFYAKNYFQTETNLLADKEKYFKYSDNIGKFNIHPLYNSNVAFTNKNRPNLYYPFYLYKNKPIKALGDEFFKIGFTPSRNAVKIFPPQSVKGDAQFVWRWGKDKASQELNKEIIGYRTEGGEYRIVQKMRRAEKLIRSILSAKEYTSRRGTAEVEEIIGSKIFSFPKPIELIKTFFKAATSKDSFMLDSFAGSGTTAHAVLDLNKEDGGNRKFILVELEKNIAKNITAKRVKRVARGYSYKTGKGKVVKVSGLGGGFEYVELGEPLFDKDGMINEEVKYQDLASYIYFTETHTNLEKNKIKGNYLGDFGDCHYFLLFDGMYKNILNRKFLKELGSKDGKKVIYADKCLLDEEILEKHQIIFKQIPYQIKVY